MKAQEQEAVAILRGAAGVIERQGLYKGDYFDGHETAMSGFSDVAYALADLMAGGDEPKCCTLGALYWTAGRVMGTADNPTLFRGIKESLGLSEEDIPEWNDKPSQRKDRVVAALRRAANYIEENASE